MDTTSITQTLPTLHTLLGEVLEVCIHQILYQRQLYPRDIFVATREYMGIRCYVANHEGLSSYIVQTLDVAIPAICSGIADRLSLVILDTIDDDDDHVIEVQDEARNAIENNDNESHRTNLTANKRNIEPRIVESYSFDIDSLLLSQAWQQQKKTQKIEILDGPMQGVIPEWTASKVQALENSFKNLLLKIITMEHTLPNQRKRRRRQSSNGQASSSSSSSPYFSDRATFRLQLHTAETHQFEKRNITWDDCKEFQHVVKQGIWYQPEDNNTNSESRNNSSDGSSTMATTRTTTTNGVTNDSNTNKNFAIAAIKSVSVPDCYLRMQMTVELLA